MSELIDRIFDVEKISGEITTIINGLKEVDSVIKSLAGGVSSIEGGVRKVKEVNGLSEASGKLNDNFTKGSEAMKKWEVEVAKLQEKTKQLTDTEKQANIEIAKARLELQAAQKATKEAAIAEIELTSKNKDLAGSYNALQKDLKNSIAAYKALSAEEANGAKGKELLNKIGETQTALKKSDAAMGNYQRNVGNYSSAIEGLTPRLDGLAGTLLDIAKSAKKNGDEFTEMGKNTNLGFKSMGQAPAGLGKIVAGFKGLGQTVAAVGKAILANPIGLVIAAIVLIFSQLKAALNESEERTNKLSLAFAQFKPILRTIGDLFEGLLDIVITSVEWFGKAYAAVTEFLGINPKGSADEFVKAEKLKQDAIKANRALSEDAAKQEAIIAEQRAIISDKENYTFKQRMDALKIAKKAENQLADDKLKIAKNNLKALEAEAELDDNNAEMNNKLSAARIALMNADKEAADVRRKLAKEEQKLIKENEADRKAEADAAKAAMDKIIAARRRLVDSSFALMVESREKSLKLSQEMYNREIEDLRRNGELTKALAKNLALLQRQEIEKINKEWNAKDLNDKIKADELVLDNMRKAGDDTLLFEKQLLQKRMDAEIMAGGDALEIRQKYQYLQKDLEAKNADDRFKLFEETLKKEVEALKDGYDKQAKEAKEAYARGEMSKEQYEAKLVDIQAEAMREANKKTIELLKTQLNSAELSADKRAELSKKIAQLEIDNENAVTDAVIANNEKKKQSDEDWKNRRMQIASDLLNAGMELFGAIGEFQAQQYEKRIAEFEKEQEASDSAFEADQNKLDNAIMSDETRAAKQKELNEKKAASDKALADKIQAEKIKQAKWEKAQGIISAIISTAQGVAGALAMMPWSPLNLVFAALAATSGAVQIATIASQQIPAYEMGGTTEGGAVLWGEKRPEVAVTPSGETFLATAPTITDFQAGTKIYKSVSDYETYMAKQAVKEVTFDYDKFGEMMPRLDFEFDGAGLFSVRDKIGNRRTMINRRHKR